MGVSLMRDPSVELPFLLTMAEAVDPEPESQESSDHREGLCARLE